MQKNQILSSQTHNAEDGSMTTPQSEVASERLIFNACHLGMVLRTVLAVESVIAIAGIYHSHSVMDWILHFSWLTSGALPGALLWLLVACAFKHQLQHLARPLQYMLSIILGMACGAYASWMISLTSPLVAAHWLANACSAGLMAAALVRFQVLRSEGKTPAATSAQLAVLQARIRPHFLFNALNSAVALVRENPRKAERLLEDLSDLFRAVLQDPRASVSLDEEIELAKRYLDIEQIRFGDRLQVVWDIDPLTLNVCLPPLLLQPLVENAVKHGVEPSEIGAKVTIRTEIAQKKFLLLRVTNTLSSSSFQGLEEKTRKGEGMALTNVERRLRLLHDVQAEFKVIQKKGLFEVQITLPSS